MKSNSNWDPQSPDLSCYWYWWDQSDLTLRGSGHIYIKHNYDLKKSKFSGEESQGY